MLHIHFVPNETDIKKQTPRCKLQFFENLADFSSVTELLPTTMLL